MSCPDIYINPTHWTTPHPAQYGNLAIDVGVGVGGVATNFHTGATRTIRVTVRNHGTDPSPQSRLQLFCSDPATSFSVIVQIDVDKLITVDGGDGIATDGETPENFSFTPTSSLLSHNGGHVCLLAQVQNESSPTGAGCVTQGHTTLATAATDARSAIRNIHVMAPPKPKMGPAPAGGGDKGMNFAFVVADAAAQRDETRLEVRALDPRKDRERLEQLVTDPAVFETLARRQAKFAVPDAVLLGDGAERVVLPRPTVVLKRAGKALRRLPRIGHLGPLSNPTAARLLLEGTKLTDPKRVQPMKLSPGERRQAIVHVVPKGDNEIYAVSVEHKGAKDRVVGGLVLVFVSPPSFF